MCHDIVSIYVNINIRTYSDISPLTHNPVVSLTPSNHTMNTASISFSCKEHLAPLLQELDTQADAVLASVSVIQNVRQEYEKATNSEERSECATVLREHGVALETDLSIIKLNAELLNDEILETWIDAATNADEKKVGNSKCKL
jgi:hypothetical protein